MMDIIANVLMVAGAYFLFKKGRAFYIKRMALYRGAKKSNHWGHLKDVFKILPSEPDKVLFTNRFLKMIYNFNPYYVYVNVKIGPSKKVLDDFVIVAITDNRLKEAADLTDEQGKKKYPGLTVAVSSHEKNPRNLSEEFKNLINDYVDDYESIARKKLTSSYDEVGIH